MTTPGGVPNLPMGALTLDTLASKLQDMSGDAMKARAVERFPSIFDTSTGLNPLSDLTPFGILTRIWAEVNSLIANSDPADIDGPEDLPPLLLDFIEGLPVIGELVGLLEAILGDYDGDDTVLLQVQAIFAPIRALAQLFSGTDDGFPSLEEIPATIAELIETRLRLPGLFVHRDDVLGSGGGFPYTFPIEFGQATTDQQLWFQRLRELLGTNLLVPGFDPSAALLQFVTSLLTTNLLAELVNGRLPDSQAPPIVQLIIDTLGQIILGINTVANPFSIFTQAIQAIFSGFTGAQSTATSASSTAQAALSAATSPGVSGTDFFDHAAGTLASPYTVVAYPPGTFGDMVWDGAGKVDWQKSGGNTHRQFASSGLSTSTDTQEVTVVFDRVVEATSSGDPSYSYILGRVNTAATIFTAARIGADTAQLLYSNGAGVMVNMGSSVAIVANPGDTWKLQLGFSGATYRVVLKQNDYTIRDVTDTNPTVGASNRFGGFGMEAGSRNAAATQTMPANFDSLTVADRTP